MEGTVTIGNMEIEVGQRGELHFRCRDIGYGVEENIGEYVYVGRETYGKLTFSPKPQGDDIYLFQDEIINWSPLAPDNIRTYTVRDRDEHVLLWS